MKILYVCPRYYYPSHLRSFADREVQALSSFAQVDLLHYDFSCLNSLGNISWFISYFITLSLAMIKSDRYDVLYLRDGDPFLFLPVMMSIPFRNRHWVINVIGIPSNRSRLFNCPVWLPFYRLAFRYNGFAFTCENEQTGHYMRKGYLQGILNGRVRILPVGVSR